MRTVAVALLDLLGIAASDRYVSRVTTCALPAPDARTVVKRQARRRM
jgi:hypothetical protein